MEKKSKQKAEALTRRSFIKTSATVGAGLAAMMSGVGSAVGASDKIRVGLIGCGGRGTGAVKDCVEADPAGIEIVALGDLVQDRVDEALKSLKANLGDTVVTATPETCFTGFDSYKKVLACDVDLVILATPPGFRPEHLEAAIHAGKHVFMEKPVAVDPVGVRSVIASSKLAKSKNLAIVAGTQRRHQADYIDIMNRIGDGAIGEVVSGQCYWNMGALWVKPKQPEWSEMEWQCRNWLYFTWLSGDHICEQHIHNIDVINWAIGAMPVKCMAMGGREVRTGPEYGNIFDHFAVEYEYPNGARVLSMCRQTPGCANRVSELIVGTKGSAWNNGIRSHDGWNNYKYEGPSPNPYVMEHKDLIDSIRKNEVLNEGEQVAQSTLCAIMGRMSAYTGRELSWKWVMNASKLDLRPAKYEMGDLPVEPVAVPGVTELI